MEEEGEEQPGLLDKREKNERKECERTTRQVYGSSQFPRSWFHKDELNWSAE